MDLWVIFRYVQNNYRARNQFLSKYCNICARVCPNSQVLVPEKEILTEKLCAMVTKFCISNKIYLSNRVKKEAKKVTLMSEKTPSKRLDELAKAFRIMSLSTLLIKFWKALYRVYEVHTKKKNSPTYNCFKRTYLGGNTKKCLFFLWPRQFYHSPLDLAEMSSEQFLQAGFLQYRREQ